MDRVGGSHKAPPWRKSYSQSVAAERARISLLKGWVPWWVSQSQEVRPKHMDTGATWKGSVGCICVCLWTGVTLMITEVEDMNERERNEHRESWRGTRRRGRNYMNAMVIYEIQDFQKCVPHITCEDSPGNVFFILMCFQVNRIQLHMYSMAIVCLILF